MQLLSVLNPVCDNVRHWSNVHPHCARLQNLAGKIDVGTAKNQHNAGKKCKLGKVLLSTLGRNFLLLVLALLRSVELCSCKTASAEV